KGVWWLPDSPDHRVAGVLSRSIRANQVEFFGTDADLFVGLNRTGLQPTWTGQIVLGTLENGQRCTLFDAHEQANEHRSAGYARSIVESGWLLLGAHFQTPESILFNSLRLDFTNLSEWMWKNSVAELERTQGEERYGWRATCEVGLPPYS